MRKNTRIIQLPCYSDNTGNLVPIEALDTIPFRLKRVYYIFGTSTGAHRGFHAHIALEQLLICVSGSVTILVKNPQQEEEILLDTPTKGLYTVSYTHLDVYKRQLSESIFGAKSNCIFGNSGICLSRYILYF